MDNDNSTMEILRQLDEGEIDPSQALELIRGEGADGSSQSSRSESNWWAWWLVIFSFGMAGAGAGYGLSLLGGAWWICAGPLLVLGIVTMLLAVLTIQSPWVHIRVYTGENSWPRRLAISLPLPLRLTAWVLRLISPRIDSFNRTMVDELIIALEGSLSTEAPITIEVNEGGSGERVEVILG